MSGFVVLDKIVNNYHETINYFIPESVIENIAAISKPNVSDKAQHYPTS